MEWFETFFQGVAVDFWSKAMTAELTAADVAFLEKALLTGPGARILDVPCGNGRHSIELARRGCRVTGVDISADFLAAARAAAPAIEWRQGDMRDLPWTAEFDGAFCFGNSFGYLDRDGAAVMLMALARALKPGGRLAIETGVAAESILPALVPRRWHRFDDIVVLSECRYVAEASRMDIDYTFIRNGVAETRPASSYVFTVAEYRRMLADAGFGEVAAYGSVAGEPFQLGSPRLILVARKKD